MIILREITIFSDQSSLSFYWSVVIGILIRSAVGKIELTIVKLGLCLDG